MIHISKKSKLVSCILTIAMIFMLWPEAAYAADGPVRIIGAQIAADNTAITVTFSEGIYTDKDEEGRVTGAVTAEDFTLNFVKNAGNTSAAEITALKNLSGEALTGGEDTVVFNIATTGKAMGVETIEVKVKDGTSVYNDAGEAMAAGQTTGVKNLHDKFPPEIYTNYPMVGAMQAFGSKQVEIKVKTYEDVTTWYVVVAKDSGLPSAENVKLGNNASGTPALASGKDILLAKHQEKSIIAGPLPDKNTAYDAYLIIEDIKKNTMVTPKKVTVTTPDGPVEVTSITVTGQDGAETMKCFRDSGSLQMLAEVLPEGADNKAVTWSVIGKGNSWLKVAPGEIGAGFAYIGPDTGLMNQGHTVGVITVKATATDGSGVFGEKDITITGVNMSSSMSTLVGKTHTITATPVPALAAGDQLTWVSSNKAAVTVDQDGNITAVGLGSADITAITPDGRQGIATVTVGKFPYNYITAFSFSQQTAPASIDGISVVNIGVSEETDLRKLVATFTISEKASVTVNGVTQVSGVTVNDFTNPVVYKVTAENGDVRDWIITVSKPYVSVSSINVTGAGGISTVDNGQTLHLSAEILPASANNKTVTWSISDENGATATINATGLLTATSGPGTVTAKAKATDGSGIIGTLVVSITAARPSVPVSSITVRGAGDATSVKKGNTLQMNAVVLPIDATNSKVRWSIENGTGSATVSDAGLLTAIKAGTVTVKATANDGTDITGTSFITITSESSSSGSSGGSIPTPAGTSINNSGGTVNDKGVTVNIPVNAVDSAIRVTVARVSSSSMSVPGDLELVSDVFEITKDKSGDFNRDVTITLPFDKHQVDEGQDELAIYWWNGNRWIALENIKINWSAGTISGAVNHFSKFAVLAKHKPQTEPEPEKPKTIPETSKPVTVLFNDINGHWAKNAINNLVASGVVSGYPDGSFKPERTITRAEFAVSVVNGFKIPSAPGKVFGDTVGHWAQDAISTAYAAGIISGYNEGAFGPDDAVTREQMAVMIAKAALLSSVSEGQDFTDSKNISSWAQESVTAAYTRHLISGYPDNTFRPQNQATRAEAVSILSRALEK